MCTCNCLRHRGISSSWRVASHFISDGVFGTGNAWYYGDTIAFTLLDGGYPDLAEFVKTAGSAMTVISPDGATQPADGFM